MLRRFCLGLKPTRPPVISISCQHSSQMAQIATEVAAVPKNDLKSNIAKVTLLGKSLSLNIRTDYMTPEVINRLAACPTNFVAELIADLTDYGFVGRDLALVLRTYDDWSVLTRAQLATTIEIFRALSLDSDMFRAVFGGNSSIVNTDLRALSIRLNVLKNYLTNRHLRNVLPKSPQLLTDSFDSFRYKFVYMYVLMGVRQNDMCASYVFNHSMRHIRERHLFLARALLYDRPSKKGDTRVENPKLNAIMDLPLGEYLKRCTNSAFDADDYHAFCEYLSAEFVDNELLGNRLEKGLRDQIMDAIKHEKHVNFLKENEDED
jgi:hypothetical protein